MTHINQERLVEHFCQLVRIDSESKKRKTNCRNTGRTARRARLYRAQASSA
ncbi:peptidase, M20A family [Vibrio sp. JCM 19053]|nr:peptidase, M20A family [Vibrio sp. JCM 19053]